jgi:hypothetical protein
VELSIKDGVSLSSEIKLEKIPHELELIEKDIRRENIFGWHFRAKTNGECHLAFKSNKGQVSSGLWSQTASSP